MKAKDALEQDRRAFLQVAGVATATFTLRGLSSAAHAVTEGTGKMKIENVGLMSPGDMGQAVAMQIKAKGLNVYTALEQRSERTRALAREAGLTDLSGKMPSLRYIVAQRSPKENEAHGRQLCRSSPDRPAHQR